MLKFQTSKDYLWNIKDTLVEQGYLPIYNIISGALLTVLIILCALLRLKESSFVWLH